MLRCAGSTRLAATVTIITVWCAFGRVASAQSAANVAVIVNENSPASQRIGEYYARKRGIPVTQILRIRTSTAETVERGEYFATIETPLATQLIRGRLQDRILYLVLTKGIPLRVSGTSGPAGNVASVDSELTLLYRRMTGATVPIAGRIDNPYYLNLRALEDARPFSHRRHDIFLVTRLDGYTVDDAVALIDRGAAPSAQGRIVLDQQQGLAIRMGEDWLQQTADQLTARGHGARVLLEKTSSGVRDVAPVLGYYSWGSTDPGNRVRRYGLGFVPGAIAGMFVSTGARTFAEPPPDWVPSAGPDQSRWFGGSPESLLGDLIREGVTGVSGHVEEPALESVVRPDILFPAYLAGFNLVEAFYLATPYLSWQNIVIGDPLCSPFNRVSSDIEENPGEDAVTLLPEFFSGRRVAALEAALPQIPRQAIVLNIRAEALVAGGSRAGAQDAFERAIAVAPQFATAHMQLAQLHELGGEFGRAAESYRKVVDLQPENVAALNNLAYILAERVRNLAEALPFARRAGALAPQNPVVLHTLAWIEYLSGDAAAAAKRMPQILRGLPQNAEVHIHAAVIYAATGNRALAEAQMRDALRIDPSLESAEVVKELRTQLSKLRPE